MTILGLDNLLIVGRQAVTGFDRRIDLLAVASLSQLDGRDLYVSFGVYDQRTWEDARDKTSLEPRPKADPLAAPRICERCSAATARFAGSA